MRLNPAVIIKLMRKIIVGFILVLLSFQLGDACAMQAATGEILTDKMYSVIKVFSNTYGETNFDGLLEDSNFMEAMKKGGNNVPRSLAATALVHAFIYRYEGKGNNLEDAKQLIRALLEKYPFWKAANIPPDISFNLTSTTAFNIGLASWLIWDEMDLSLKSAVKNMLIKESDYNLLRKPASGFLKDTKADENAVVPSLLILSALLFPQEANAKIWEEQGLCFAYHSITISKDAPFCGLKTQTAYDDFTMDNHGFGPHPLYMAAPLVLFADAALVYIASGKRIPDELKHNVIPLWVRVKNFVDKDFRYTTKNSWTPTGLSREVSAVAYMSVIMGIDSEFEVKLLDYKIRHEKGFVEKDMGKVKKLVALSSRDLIKMLSISTPVL